MKIVIKILAAFLLFQVKFGRSQWDTPKPARRNQFPHQASIFWGTPPEPPLHSCAGGIIHERWILSSGYCVGQILLLNNTAVALIKVGLFDTSADDSHTQQFYMEKGIVHEKYTGTNAIANLVPYDIGLIKTNGNITFNDYVQPAALPKSDGVIGSKYKLEYNLVVSGWGIVAFGVLENHPTTLYTIQLPKVSNRVCETSIRLVIPNFEMDATQMCTRPLDGSAGACVGDYGGPLVQYIDGSRQAVIVGVQSWTIMPCDTPNQPPVYTRVPSLVKWIKKKMKKN